MPGTALMPVNSLMQIWHHRAACISKSLMHGFGQRKIEANSLMQKVHHSR
jgi:hypothetical protein